MIAFKRGCKKFPNDFSVKELYDFYKEYSQKHVDISTYRKIMYEFHEGIINRMIYDGEQIRLPFKLGTLLITKKRKKILLNENYYLDRRFDSVNWHNTKKLWDAKFPGLTEEEILKIPIAERGLRFNNNDTTNRYILGFKWDKYTSPLINKSFYTFKVLRELGPRKLGKIIKEQPELYLNYIEEYSRHG